MTTQLRATKRYKLNYPDEEPVPRLPITLPRFLRNFGPEEISIVTRDSGAQTRRRLQCLVRSLFPLVMLALEDSDMEHTTVPCYDAIEPFRCHQSQVTWLPRPGCLAFMSIITTDQRLCLIQDKAVMDSSSPIELVDDFVVFIPSAYVNGQRVREPYFMFALFSQYLLTHCLAKPPSNWFGDPCQVGTLVGDDYCLVTYPITYLCDWKWYNTVVGYCKLDTRCLPRIHPDMNDDLMRCVWEFLF